MVQFRRAAAAVALFALLLAATPAPAAARPWTTGFEDGFSGVQWRVITWVLKAFKSRPTLTNVTANDGAKLQP